MSATFTVTYPNENRIAITSMDDILNWRDWGPYNLDRLTSLANGEIRIFLTEDGNGSYCEIERGQS